MEPQNTIDAGAEGERSTLLVTYILHALAPFTALSAIIAVIISHIKVKETQNEFIHSHHSWLIRTFWWCLLWTLICIPLVLVLVGALGFVLVGVWWLYRTIRGFINFNERKPMPG